MIGTLGSAVLDGFLGNTISGGSGRSLASAAGVVAGGVAGDQIGGAIGRTDSLELEIKTDQKENVVVVQKLGTTKFRPGQRVSMAQRGVIPSPSRHCKLATNGKTGVQTADKVLSDQEVIPSSLFLVP